MEWSFIGSSSSTTLQISPNWERKEIGFNYETTLDVDNASTSTLVPIEIVIPEGWGWSHFDIQGPSLISFRSTDVEAWHMTSYQPQSQVEEESFTTIRNIIPPTLRNPNLTGSRSSSLMRQSLPDDVRVDEFSFENQDDSGSAETVTASPSVQTERRIIAPNQPTAARLFDLVFDDESDDRSFAIEGILVPLFPTLVSGAVPVSIPFVTRSGGCQVTCPDSNLLDEEVNSDISSIGEFTWVDMFGCPVPSSTIPMKGDVRVRLMKDTWGSIRMSLLFPVKKGEVAFSVGKSAHIRKAEVDGMPVRFGTTTVGHEQVVRLGCEGLGVAEVVLDLAEGDIVLPRFEGSEGTMMVEFRGTGWECRFSRSSLYA